jgi:hypothetical protein
MFAGHGYLPRFDDAAMSPSSFTKTDLFESLSSVGALLERESRTSGVVPHDIDALKICSHFLLGDDTTLNLKAESKFVEVDSKKLQLMKHELAAGCVLLDRVGSVAIMRKVVSDVSAASDARLLTISEASRYDETPMVFKHRSASFQRELEAASKLVQIPGIASSLCGGDTLPLKVNHTMSSAGILVRVGAAYFFLEFKYPHWLQAMDSTQANCYFRCVQQHSLPLAAIASAFHRRQRIICNDGDGAIEKCERLVESRVPAIASMRNKCEVHRASGMRTKTMNVFGVMIRFLIHMSLSIGFGSAVAIMRQELKGVFKDKVDYVPHTSPPPSAKSELKHLLDIFASIRTPSTRLRRVIIETLFTGSPSSSRIQHFCKGCCSGSEDCLAKFQSHGVVALAGFAPRPFPRHRWTRQEEGSNWLGLFEGLNRLFSETFRRFCCRVGVRLPANVQGGGAWAPPLLAIADAADPGLGIPEHADPVAAGLDQSEPILGDASWEQKQQQQSQSRKVVLSMLQPGGDGPLPELIVLAKTLSSQRLFMTAMLVLGGESWEHRQYADEASALLGKTSESTRELRGLVAASCRVESELMDSVSSLMMDESDWEAVPLHARSVDLKHMAFRSLSMTLCLLNEMKDMHLGYPFKCFLLLTTFGDDLERLKYDILSEPCLWCPWTSKFVHDWEFGITSVDALVDLFTTLILAKFCTSALEAKHAQIRRLLVAMSNQSKAEAFMHASSLEVLRCYRKHASDLRQLLRKVDTSTSTSSSCDNMPSSTEPAPKKIKRTGGPWRAWIILETAGTDGTCDFVDLARRYNQLTGDEREEVLRLGASMTEQHREGGHSMFGPTSMQRERRMSLLRTENTLASFCDDPSSVPDLKDDIRLSEFCHRSDSTLAISSHVSNPWDRVMAIKTLCRAEARSAASHIKRRDDTISSFASAESLGKRIVDDCVVAFPSLAPFRASLKPQPSSTVAGACLNHVVVEPLFALTNAFHVASLPRMSKCAKKFNASLRPFWESLHEQIPSTPVAGMDAKPEKRLCFKCGVCVCEASGRTHVPIIANRLSQSLKRITPTKNLRSMLQGGCYFVLLVGRTRDQVASFDADPRVPVIASSYVWLHVGYMHFSPDHPSVQLMNGPGGDLEIVLGGTHSLACSGRAYTCCKALIGLSDQLRWDVSVFTLTQSRALLGSVAPSSAVVKPVSDSVDASLTVLWDPWKKTRAKTWVFDFDAYLGDDAGVDDDGVDGDAGDGPDSEHDEPGDEASVDAFIETR